MYNNLFVKKVRKKLKMILLANFLLLSLGINAQQAPKTDMAPSEIINVNGVFPHLSLIGDHYGRSETGIGALLPWANKLWMVGYVAHIHGSGVGLYEIGQDMRAVMRSESVTGTYANRMVHDPSNYGIIGPYRIDPKGNVSVFETLVRHRLTATMEHLTKPDSMVYFLTMEGLLFEANVYTMKTNLVEDLVKTFYKSDYQTLYGKGIWMHFKGGFTGNGRVIVANNSYQNEDYTGKVKGGILAEWNGKTWTVLDSTAYIEVKGKMSDIYGNGIWATGWDRKSVKMMYYSPEKKWRTYRLPKGSQAWEHAWNTEWMRIREAQTERFMMDVFGIFYELPVMTYGGNMLSIKPVCNHLRVIPDYVYWRGMLVLAGDQTDNAVAQPQSNLQFINIDDLWQWGKPSGFGNLWWDEEVKANTPSDPYLMHGFDKKVIHFRHNSSAPVKFKIEVDLMGDDNWSTYKIIDAPAKGYAFEAFPEGYSAQWLRVTPLSNVNKATVQVVYN